MGCADNGFVHVGMRARQSHTLAYNRIHELGYNQLRTLLVRRKAGDSVDMSVGRGEWGKREVGAAGAETKGEKRMKGE